MAALVVFAIDLRCSGVISAENCDSCGRSRSTPFCAREKGTSNHPQQEWIRVTGSGTLRLEGKSTCRDLKRGVEAIALSRGSSGMVFVNAGFRKMHNFRAGEGHTLGSVVSAETGEKTLTDVQRRLASVNDQSQNGSSLRGLAAWAGNAVGRRRLPVHGLPLVGRYHEGVSEACVAKRLTCERGSGFFGTRIKLSVWDSSFLRTLTLYLGCRADRSLSGMKPGQYVGRPKARSGGMTIFHHGNTWTCARIGR